MPKILENESVLHDWISKLTFQQQALLLTGMRGPDNTEKETSAKAMVRYLRGVVLKPAGMCNLNENDNFFMWGDYDIFQSYASEFYTNHDHYPHHFMLHLIHCAELIGYKHPEELIRNAWLWFYHLMCNAFHMVPESEIEMDNRLNDFKSNP